MSNLSVIIPAAGPGHRMKSYGPKALIPLNNGQTVIHRQLAIIETLYPKSEVIVAIGFEAEKLRERLPLNIKTVYNAQYEHTNVAYSLDLALSIASYDKVLIVYGDLVFNAEALKDLITSESRIIVDSQSQLKREEVGVTIVDNKATRFSYGLPIKWGQIAYLTGRELNIFRKLIHNINKRRLFGFEILNQLLDANGSLYTLEPQRLSIAEIDTSKDIESARKIV